MIVPVNSQSERALVANLGNLEVHNNFKIVQGGVGEDTAVVDNMAVSFTSLQLSVYVISFYCEFSVKVASRIFCTACDRFLTIRVINRLVASLLSKLVTHKLYEQFVTSLQITFSN